MICPNCKTRLVKKKIEYSLLGERIGIFLADICLKCNEQFFDPKVSLEIEKIAKSKGLWDLKFKTKVNKLGNSLAIRLNKKLIDFLKIEKGEEIIIYPETKHKIVIGRTKL